MPDAIWRCARGHREDEVRDLCRQVAKHRTPILVGEHAEQRDNRLLGGDGRQRIREDERALRIVRDVEDETPIPLKSSSDVNQSQRSCGLVERHAIRRPRGIEQNERERDVLGLVLAGQRRRQAASCAERLEIECGTTWTDRDVADRALFGNDADLRRTRFARVTCEHLAQRSLSPTTAARPGL